MELLIKGLGRLPGDVRIRAGRVTVPFPITSTILVVTALLLAVAACDQAATSIVR
jgi:hypothetical protein